MSKYQLTISPDYVLNWTYLEAVRELFQNAIDNQTVNPENEMFFSYENGVLKIGNKTSILTMDTLLLGSSSKRDDDRTIGKHGEGYKVSWMVLLREGKKVTLYNYGAKQVWTTRLVKSRKYNGALITEITVNKKFPWQSVPSHNMVIEIEGVTQEEYENIVEHNLHLQDEYQKYTTTNGMGEILLDEKYMGKVFVNGLYVAENPKFEHGYNIAPQHIKLDRDRKLIDTIDLAFISSKMWRYVDQPDSIADMLLREVWDVKYIKSRKDFYTKRDEEAEIDSKISSSLKEKFIESNGTKAFPVSNNSDLQRVSRKSVAVTPIMTSREVTEYLEDEMDESPSLTRLPPKEQLEEWLEKVKHKLSDEEVSDFEIILSEMNPF